MTRQGILNHERSSKPYDESKSGDPLVNSPITNRLITFGMEVVIFYQTFIRTFDAYISPG